MVADPRAPPHPSAFGDALAAAGGAGGRHQPQQGPSFPAGTLFSFRDPPFLPDPSAELIIASAPAWQELGSPSREEVSRSCEPLCAVKTSSGCVFGGVTSVGAPGMPSSQTRSEGEDGWAGPGEQVRAGMPRT